MKRSILAVVVGLVVWVIVVSLLNRGLRMALPGYAAVEKTMEFTLAMMVGRLSIAAITSLVAGAVTAAIARTGVRMPWVVGAILLLLFVPLHIKIWNLLPAWYHLTFLLTLAPLVAAGGVLLRLRTAGDSPANGGKQRALNA
jgi:hypothetical protein